MGTNDEYFASLAQLILATAASQKAEQDRKDELAFRRQQAAESLALQREGLALERDRTQAQIATEEERRKGLSSERDRAERADTVAAIDDSMYRMETGETPAQTKMRLSRKKDEAGVRAAEAQAMTLEGEAENAPADRALKRQVDESNLKASEASRAFTETQRAEFAAGAEHRRKMEELALATAEKQNRGLDIDLTRKQREAEQSMRDSIARRFGQMTPDDRAALDLGFKKLKMESMFQAAEKAAMDPVTGTFNPDVYNKEIAKIESAANMAGGLGLLSKRDPAKFKDLQAAASKAAMDIIGSGGSPSVAFAAVRNMVDTVVKTTKPTANEPPPKPVESQRRLALKQDKTKDIEARIQYSIQETIKDLPDDVLAALESKYGGDPAKIAEAIRKALPKDSEGVPPNRVIATVARAVSGSIPRIAAIDIKK